MISYRPLNTFSAILLLGGALLAQDGALYSVSVDNPNGDAIRDAVSGDFDGDLRTDLIVVVDDVPQVLWAPSVYGWNVVLSEVGAVDDIVAVEVGPPKLHVLVTASASGLTEWEYQASTSTFTGTSLDASSAWQGVSELHVYDLDGIDPSDFVAIHSGGTSLVTLTRAGTSSTVGSISLPTSVTSATAMTPVRWLGTLTYEFAVATDDELVVVDVAGNLLDSFSGGGTHAALEQIWMADHARHGVVWGRQTAPNTNLVGARHSSAIGSQEPDRHIGAFQPRSIAAGDFDGDSDSDLFVSGPFSNLGIFMNQVPLASQPRWAVTTPNSYAIALHPTQVAGAAPGIGIANIDGDGDNDAFSTVDVAGIVTIQHGVLVSETAGRLEVPKESGPGGLQYHLHPPESTLSFNVTNVPLTVGTHLELIARREVDPSASPSGFQAVPQYYDRHSLASEDRTDPAGINVTLSLGPGLDLPAGESEFIGIQVRLVTIDPSTDELIWAGHENAFTIEVDGGGGIKQGTGEIPPIRPIVPPSC